MERKGRIIEKKGKNLLLMIMVILEFSQFQVLRIWKIHGEVNFQSLLSRSRFLYLLVKTFLLLASRSSFGISFHTFAP